MKKVLVTGCAGYIGSNLVRKLLFETSYYVKGFDCLNYGIEPILSLLEHPSFELKIGDIRDSDMVDEALDDVWAVIHLASVVGDPACAAQPELAKSVNLNATKHLYNEALKKGVARFIFASTCSNYGKSQNPDEYMNESSPLNPVSIYAKTKVDVENYLLGQPSTNSCVPTCLRFATCYGISPRNRFDLTVNEFTRDIVLDKEVIIFGKQFWRPYCHVNDLANAMMAVLQSSNGSTAFEIFNVGDTDENYTKQMLVDRIVEQVGKGKIKYVDKKEDPRDYRVNFDKISKKLGFQISKKLSDGIEEIQYWVGNGFIPDPYHQRFKNT